MKKAIITILLCIIVLGILCSASDVELVKKAEIKEAVLKKYEQSEGEEKNKLKTQIIKSILNVTDDKYSITNDSALTVLYGDVAADEKEEAIFVVSLGPKNSVIAVYEKVGSEYTYLGKIDNLFKIEAIQVLETGKNEKSIIFFREIADQMLGAFESDVFLRAYKWDGNKFNSVLNVIQNYRAYWNELWDKVKAPEDSHWLSIAQQGEADYLAIPVPTVYLKMKQKYLESNQTNLVNLPSDAEFELKRQRDLAQTYYWSSKWNNFIIGEGTELKTGNVVAIIEDLSQGPFSLIEEDNRYRIKRSDGTIEVVYKNSIIPIKK